jgi:hypothetical protein
MSYASSVTQEGWGVYRVTPWHMQGLYLTEAEAVLEAEKAGFQYSVDFGRSHRPTGNFTLLSARMLPPLYGCA